MHNQFHKNCKFFKNTFFKQMKERRNGYKLKASVICKTVTYQERFIVEPKRCVSVALSMRETAVQRHPCSHGFFFWCCTHIETYYKSFPSV